MTTLTLRTDKPEAEIGLYQAGQEIVYLTWPAHRELAETIHYKIAEILQAQKLSLHNLEAIVIYKGPGSFTGLRIGIAVANTLAHSLAIPVIGTSGLDWRVIGLKALRRGQNDHTVQPEYGALPNITAPRK